MVLTVVVKMMLPMAMTKGHMGELATITKVHMVADIVMMAVTMVGAMMMAVLAAAMTMAPVVRTCSAVFCVCMRFVWNHMSG